MAQFQPAPTYAEVVLIDEKTGKARFNPIWLKWFTDMVQIINASGGGSGTIQHNDTGGLQGGTTNQFYHLTAAAHAALGTSVAGVWTPTLTNVTNLSASTAYQCQYIRIGATVAFAGKVDADPTAAGAVELGISLPVSTNFGATEDLGGTGFSPAVAGLGAALLADTANDRASMQWIAVDTANRSFYFSGAYQVI